MASSNPNRLYVIQGGATGGEERVKEKLSGDLECVKRMSEGECYEALLRVYKIMGKDEPRVIPDENRGNHLVIWDKSKGEDIANFITIRDALREILMDTLSRL